MGLDFDSYILSLDVIRFGDYYLLEVDNRCVLPLDLIIRFCISSSDVIHSWAIPRLSVKIDAIRGLLRIFNSSFDVVGLYFGQCSEICGSNHSFMPICLEVCPNLRFLFWLFLKT